VPDPVAAAQSAVRGSDAPVLATRRMPIRQSEDIVRMRQAVRERAVALGFGLVDQTKMVTAASELARNALLHGGGGDVEIVEIGDGHRRTGLKLVFGDQGPGIADVALALKDGYTSGNGLGLGLGGARRLVNEFAIESAPGKGTRVTIVRWR
jgi:serine/threonine-protein kinase RsbT